MHHHIEFPQVVECYRNLRRKCFSVRAGKPKRVIGHRKSLVLTSCVFHVSQAGNARVRRERQKDVHAVVRGFLRDDLYWADPQRDGFTQVSYNPYQVTQFCYSFADGKPDPSQPIHNARIVILTSEGKILVKS